MPAEKRQPVRATDQREIPAGRGGRLVAWLVLAICSATASMVCAQTAITQNNLIQNGGFDSGGTAWTTAANGVYFYNDGTENILSFGWTDGSTFSQNTGATIQPGMDYVFTIRAQCAQSPVTGLQLSLSDATAGGTLFSNRNFIFPDQTPTWRTFSLLVSSNLLSRAAGDSFSVGGRLNESPNSQYGWIWVDWVQLASAVPYFKAQPQSATNYVGASGGLSASAIGAVTNTTGPGSAIQYQWYQAPGIPLAGVTNASLFFSTLSATNSGTYYVVASGPFGTRQSSNATLVIQPAPLPQYTAAVNPNQALVDNFVGWGTSLCWWANVCGGYPNRNAYASLAFTTLGLNIVRYNIGGGENPGLTSTLSFRAQMPGFEPTNGVWNWNADANQRWMLRQAVALGANHVVAFANSPPWWMTVSGSVTGSAGGTGNNLQTGYENTFAQYLATVVSNLTVLDGVKFDLVTPMNEPTANYWVYGGNQEGCHMDAAQQNRVVNDLRADLNSSGLAAGIDASEDTDEQDTVNSVGSYDATGQANVTLVASHTYGANNPGGLQSLATALGKPWWISEYSEGDATGMTMARRIHDDITQAGVQAWVYWQVVDNYGGWGMLYNPEDGTGNSAYTFNEKFYVMWQFSHFIRPGCQIINAGDDNSLVAYDRTNHNLIIVAQNDTTNAFNVNYALGSFASTGSRASCWRTSSHESGAPLAALTITNQQLVAYLAPLSVTTLVLSNVYATLPLAWYPLEGNGLDATGNGNNATLVTNLTFVAGRMGALAAQFSGNTNSYMVIPRCLSNSFTITCWVRTTATGGASQWWNGKGIVDGEVSGSVADFGLTLVGKTAGFGMGNPDTTIVSTNAINDGQWHHLAAAWNSFTGLMQLYVDGLLQAATTGPTGARTAPPSLRLGSLQAAYAGGFLTGSIDDVQLFGWVLSPAEVAGTMNHAPVLAPVPDSTVLAGRTLLVTNTVTDPAVPAETLTWSLLGAASGASIRSLNSTNGVFSWRPAMGQSPSTNSFKVVVTDNGTPQLSATQTQVVIVQQPAPPTLVAPALGHGSWSFNITGASGPDYVIQATSSLNVTSHWLPVLTNFNATPPFQFNENSATNFPGKFYRVLLQP